MDVTDKTTVAEAAPFLKPEHLRQLIESDRIAPIKGDKSVFEMSIGEFLQCLTDDYAQQFFSNPDELLVVAVGRLKHFKSEMDNVNRILSLNEIKLTAEEKAAQRGVVFPSFGESVLCETVEYFHLNSFDDAEKIPLTNYLIMKRKKGAEALYTRNLNRIYSEKSNKKK